MARPAGHKANGAAWKDIADLRGLTPTQIAATSQIPRPTISLLASGINRASIPMARKVADAMGVSVETIFPTISDDFAEKKTAA